VNEEKNVKAPADYRTVCGGGGGGGGG